MKGTNKTVAALKLNVGNLLKIFWSDCRTCHFLICDDGLSTDYEYDISNSNQDSVWELYSKVVTGRNTPYWENQYGDPALSV